MPEKSEQSALRRMLGTARPAPEMVSMSPPVALRKAMVHAARDLGGLTLSVTSFDESRVTLAATLDKLPDHALLLRLQGADRGIGLAVIDHAVMVALVEHVTTGRISSGDSDPRPCTGIDAVLVGDLLDRALAGFERNLDGLRDVPPVVGYRYARAVDDPRELGLAMEEIPYRNYTLGLDLGLGAAQGRLQLVLPWFQASMQQLDKKNASEWARILDATVSRSTAEMEAVLYRFSVALSEISGWKEGALVDVPVSALDSVSVEGSDHRKVSAARLGQSSGMRAIRIQCASDRRDAVAEPEEFGGALAVALAAPDTTAKPPNPDQNGVGDLPPQKGSE